MNVILKLPSGLNGAVQIGDFAKKTINGQAEFEVEPGEYRIRGMALGFRGIQRVENIHMDNQVIEIDVRSD